MSRMIRKLAIDLPPELHEWFISTAKELGLSQNQFLQKLRELWELADEDLVEKLWEKGEEK